LQPLTFQRPDDQFDELRDVARRRFLESYGTVIGYLAEAAGKAKGVKPKEELKELRDGIYGRLAFFRTRAFAVGSIFPEAEGSGGGGQERIEGRQGGRPRFASPPFGEGQILTVRPASFK
jgi:hypothetical protein